MSFLGELKRRNVFRVAGVYTVVAWLLVQVAATVEEAIALPQWFDAVVLSFLVIVFPIALIFAWAFELTPDGIKRTSSVDEDESITAQTGSKLDIVLILSFLLFAGAMVLPRFLGDGAPGEPAADVASADPAAIEGEPAEAPTVVADPNTPPDASIAVLPFADLSPRGDQEYFADGISEELLNVLAKVKALKVAGRTSSFSFKGRNEDLKEIGRVLKVAHILEGSVRSQGDRVRVTAQLIQVSDGYHLWSETYDGNLSDIFAVQDDIAQQILVALKEQLVVVAAPEVAPAARTDVTAYGLFLEARDLIYTRDEAKMTRAKALLDQVISIDPEYAPSYAARAKAYLLLADSPSSYGQIPVQEAAERAESDVNLALEIDPLLADAHAVRGLQNDAVGNPDFAIASLRRALELNPNSLDARNWLALSLQNSGRLQEALAELAVLREIDPLFPPAVNNIMNYKDALGDYTGAVEVAEQFVALTDDPVVAADYGGRIASTRGRLADAIKLWSGVPVVDRGRTITGGLIGDYLDLGEDFRRHGLEERSPTQSAMSLARLGERTAALSLVRASLEQAPDQVSVQQAYINILKVTHEYELLMEYFETQFQGDLDVVATRLRSQSLIVPPPFRQFAVAARAVGKESVFQAAMLRYRESIDAYRKDGSVAWWFDLFDAIYWILMDQVDLGLDFLESAVEKRVVMGFFFFTWAEFDSVREHPRFVAIRDANAARINEQRAQLDLDPLPAEVFIVGYGAADQ